jgi:endonuclease YncB( thermonuclease family)
MASSTRKSGITARILTYAVVVAIVGAFYYARDHGIGTTPAVSAGSLPETAGSGFETLTGCRVIANGGNDGDSFRVRHEGEENTFRLYFVDCPETSDRYPERLEYQARYFGNLTPRQVIAIGEEAKAFTRDLLDENPFAILTRWEKVMKSYRYHAFVLVETQPGQSEYLSEILVRRGLARIYTLPADLPDGTPKEVFEEKLTRIEKEARAAKAGAWGL